MLTHCRAAIVSLALLTLITGVVYAVVVTLVAQVAFPQQANGSVIVKNGKPVGSALIGQPFDDPKYFWGRPSATSPFPDNASSSSGSNLSPTNPDLVKAVQERVATLRAADPGNTAPVPVDLVTASASGLDPHISPAPGAVLNCPRDRRARTPAATPIFCSASSDDASGLPRSVSRMVTATDAPASRVDANALAPCVSIDCEGGRVGARRVATGVARARGEGQARSPRTTRSRDPPNTPPSRGRWPRRSPPARRACRTSPSCTRAGARP